MSVEDMAEAELDLERSVFMKDLRYRPKHVHNISDKDLRLIKLELNRPVHLELVIALSVVQRLIEAGSDGSVVQFLYTTRIPELLGMLISSGEGSLIGTDETGGEIHGKEYDVSKFCIRYNREKNFILCAEGGVGHESSFLLN